MERGKKTMSLEEDLERYRKNAYGDEVTASLGDVQSLNFLWAHLMGPTDSWRRLGIENDSQSFAYEFSRRRPAGKNFMEFLEAFLQALPARNSLWTPAYYVWPQLAINRYAPSFFNAYYEEFMLERVYNKAQVYEKNDFDLKDWKEEYQLFQGSNSGDIDRETLFLYSATGSGMGVKLPKTLVSLNKMQAIYAELYRQAKMENSTDPGAQAFQDTINEYDLISEFHPGSLPFYFLVEGVRATLAQSPFDLTDEQIERQLWSQLDVYYALNSIPDQNRKRFIQLLAVNVCVPPWGTTFQNAIYPQPYPRYPKSDPNFDPSDPTPGFAFAKFSEPVTEFYQIAAYVATNVTSEYNEADVPVSWLLKNGKFYNLRGIAAAQTPPAASKLKPIYTGVLSLCQWNASAGFAAECPVGVSGTEVQLYGAWSANASDVSLATSGAWKQAMGIDGVQYRANGSPLFWTNPRRASMTISPPQPNAIAPPAPNPPPEPPAKKKRGPCGLCSEHVIPSRCSATRWCERAPAQPVCRARSSRA